MEAEVKTLPCIVCGKVPEAAMPPDVAAHFDVQWAQPYAATLFTTHGHYGSTVFDSDWREGFLQVSICDEHVLEAATAGRVLHGTPQRVPPPAPEMKPWHSGMRWCEKCGRAQLGGPDDPCDAEPPF